MDSRELSPREAMPRGLRWQPVPDGGILRVRRSMQALYVCLVIWLAGGSAAITLHLIHPKAFHGASPETMVRVLVFIALLFFYVAIRSFVNVSRCSFTNDKFSCRTGSMPPSVSVEMPVEEIDSFAADPAKNTGDGFVVALITRGNMHLSLPLQLNGYPPGIIGLLVPFIGAAPESHAEFIAQELRAALERARTGPSILRTSTSTALQ